MIAIRRQNASIPRQSFFPIGYSVFRLADINVQSGYPLMKIIGKYSESHQSC
jgi:hypothetical protein